VTESFPIILSHIHNFSRDHFAIFYLSDLLILLLLLLVLFVPTGT
jgi:hypothetical protein